MKHTEGLFQVEVWEYPQRTPPESIPTIVGGQDAVAQSLGLYRVDPKERAAEELGNTHLLAAAPWYRILALIALHWDACVLHEIGGIKDIAKGWEIFVDEQKWQWPGGVDGFGVPVPPPEKMFLEIKQAVESL